MDDVGDKTGPLAVNNEEGRMITDDDRLSKRLWSWWTRSASCLSESKGQEDSGAWTKLDNSAQESQLEKESRVL